MCWDLYAIEVEHAKHASGLFIKHISHMLSVFIIQDEWHYNLCFLFFIPVVNAVKCKGLVVEWQELKYTVFIMLKVKVKCFNKVLCFSENMVYKIIKIRMM